VGADEDAADADHDSRGLGGVEIRVTIDLQADPALPTD
jgi:hypothetical protein